ncbi:phosphotransferase-like protein [Amycolatopsis sp. cmx-11-32]|uniref:phosphotransferase-like protein n=1 Tax=Amycolatopsis sp. cmx-11-32 TaxID=2785796 RepID=UPI0039E46F36
MNGGSSSGKSGIARCLQAVLPNPWLTLGVDTLIDAMPSVPDGISFASDGGWMSGPVSGASRTRGWPVSRRWCGRVRGSSSTTRSWAAQSRNAGGGMC